MMGTGSLGRLWRLAFFALIGMVVLAACTGLGTPAGPKIKVENAWARPSRMGMGAMQGKTTSAAYLTIINEGGEADRLVGVMSDVAEHVELHQTVKEGDVMRMQPVEGGIEIPAKGKVELKPGSYHIMLIGLTRELKPGDRFSLVLEFQKSGRQTIQVEVKEE